MNLINRIYFYLLYLRKPPWDTGVSPPELMEFINHHHPGRALDLGCGSGTNVITLAQNGWHATGVDFVARAVRAARKKALQANVDVNFVVDDVTVLKKVSSQFDLILDIGCFHSLSDKGKTTYIQNLRRLLATSGSYLIYAWLSDSNNSHSGINPGDMERLSTFLNVKERQDGTWRGSKPSVWLSYVKKEPKPV